MFQEGRAMFDAIRRRYHHWDTARRIRRHGWTGIYVGDYQSAPSWAYTIGFQGALGAPEIILFDVPKESANALFHEAFRQLKFGELVLCDGEPWVLPGVEKPIVWRKVHASRLYDNDPENPWLGIAEDMARILVPEKGPIAAFQLVLSDGEGQLPWEPGYDERLRPLQRELYLPLP
jgi:hypothetical protein